MKIKNSLKIENFKLKINPRGEIATVLTLISVGLMLIGAIAGTQLAKTGPRLMPYAQQAPSTSCSNAGDTCTAGEEGLYCTKCINPIQECVTARGPEGGAQTVVQCTRQARLQLSDPIEYKWEAKNPECQVACAPPTPPPPASNCTNYTCGSTFGSSANSNSISYDFNSQKYFKDQDCKPGNGPYSTSDQALKDYCTSAAPPSTSSSTSNTCPAAQCKLSTAGCDPNTETQDISKSCSPSTSGYNTTSKICCVPKSAPPPTSLKKQGDTCGPSDVQASCQPPPCTNRETTGSSECEGLLRCCVSGTAIPPPPPGKQLGSGNHVVCSDAKTENGGICESGAKGEKQFCYHECRPDKPGYSQAVYCSGANGYEIDPPVQDPACFVQGPAPTQGLECSQPNGKPVPEEECLHVACDGLNWVQTGNVCFDGHKVEYPGKVLRAGDCSDQPNIPTCIGGKVAPTAALVNPTKSPNTQGFHIDSEIYTYNRDNGVLFEFNIKFHFDGCDGDISLAQNGNTIVQKNGWKGPGDYPYSPAWTNSPIVGNGSIQNVTYTGKLINYHCLNGKAPNSLTDSIQCRLAVDDKGNPRISGTGCSWVNQGQITPSLRPTVTPHSSTGSSNSAPSSQTCFPYVCPNNAANKFSVQNHQIFKGGDCSSGNQKNTFNEACDTITYASGCEFVGGMCKSSQSECSSLGTDYSGNGYDQWGPPGNSGGNNVNIPLCTGSQVCCEPKGGFKPNPLPTIISSTLNTAPQVSGDCTYTPGNGNISVKSPKNKGVTGVGLRVDTNTIVNPTVAPSGDTWTFDTTKISSGNHDVKFGWGACNDSGCQNYCGSITISGTSVNGKSDSTATAGSAPKCNVVVDAMTDPCAKCMNSNLTLNIDCPSLQQKINLYCTANINTCFAVFDNTCVKSTDANSKCTPQERPLLFLSYNNDSYNIVVEGMKTGIITAKYASLYVLNATRAPGLQIKYCDPTKLECDFNPAVKT